jgi:hypothetical protein
MFTSHRPLLEVRTILKRKFTAHIHTVTCILIARQRLGKHTPVAANVRNSSMSTVRQRISKHASLIIEAVLSAWSVQNGYKEGFN